MGWLRNRLKIWRHFSILELLILLFGKIYRTSGSKKYFQFQDYENKLLLLLNHSEEISILGREVCVELVKSYKSTSCFLRLVGSDVWVFNQILISRSYDCILALYLENFESKPINIIDAGANIGLASIFFKTQSPNCKIFAIEPDEQNYSLMIRNIEINQVNMILVHKAAFWPTKSKLQIVNDFRDQLSWSLRVEESQNGLIPTVTPEEAIQYFNGTIDLLKIDIEGSEFDLFNKNNDLAWLSEVRMIAVEIHEEFGNAIEIVGTLEEYGFKIYFDGELTIGVNHK